MSGILYAQFVTSLEAASYLLLLRLLTAVEQFSQVPFYTKLPILAKRWARNEVADLRNLISRGMTLSFWVHIIGVVAVAIFFPFVLALMSETTPFPSIDVWLLFGLAGLFVRYGAMNIQIYSLTNKIVLHYANGLQGIIFSVVSICFVPLIGIYGFAIAMLSASLVYSAYALFKSHNVIGKTTILCNLYSLSMPVAVIGLIILAVLINNYNVYT